MPLYSLVPLFRPLLAPVPRLSYRNPPAHACRGLIMFFVLVLVLFVIKIDVLNNFSRSINTYGYYGRPTAATYMRAAHNVLYTRSTYKCTFHILRWTSAVLLQGAWCSSRCRGCALYRDASHTAYVLGPPPSRGGDLELEGGVNVKIWRSSWNTWSGV